MSDSLLHAVGSVVLDVVRSHPNDERRDVGLGGVCFNAAVAACRETDRVRFVSTSYRGEIHDVLGVLLAHLGLDWQPLKAVAPMPLFEAIVGPGNQVEERFEGTLAYELADADFITSTARQGDAVLTCTDLSLTQLDALLDGFTTSFLLCSSSASAPLVRKLAQAPDYVGLNRAELERIARRPLTSLADIACASQHLVKPNGHGIVTLGEAGALLVSNEREAYLRLPSLGCSRINGHWIGAGDALFGTFAGAIMSGVDVDVALARGLVAATTFSVRMSPTLVNAGAAAAERLLDRASGWVPL